MVSILPLFQFLEYCFKRFNYSLYHCYLHVPLLLRLSGKVPVFVHLSLSFIFILWSNEKTKITREQVISLWIITISSRVFRTSITCWSFTVVWMIVNLPRSPWLFRVFKPWRVSNLPLISNPSSPRFKQLGIVPSTLIITGIAITLTFHCLFCFFLVQG